MTVPVNMTLGQTDWALLAQQKQGLVRLLNGTDRLSYAEREHLDGILNWIDAIQDAAELEGFPVVFLTDEG